MNRLFYSYTYSDLFAYPTVVRISKRLVSISLDKRKCIVYSWDAERLLSAFDLASSRCSRHDVEALPEEYERANDMAGEEPEHRIRSSRVREQKREDESKRKKRKGREGTTSFLVCILITSFCRKLLGIQDTQPRLGFSARTHPRVPALEREVVAIPSLIRRQGGKDGV